MKAQLYTHLSPSFVSHHTSDEHRPCRSFLKRLRHLNRMHDHVLHDDRRGCLTQLLEMSLFHRAEYGRGKGRGTEPRGPMRGLLHNVTGSCTKGAKLPRRRTASKFRMSGVSKSQSTAMYGMPIQTPYRTVPYRFVCNRHQRLPSTASLVASLATKDLREASTLARADASTNSLRRRRDRRGSRPMRGRPC